MAKSTEKVQKVMALMLALALVLAVPAATYAKDGKKHFKEGVKYEQNRQWDKAAEQFALAVAEKPSNIEFQLHLHRALVNAAVMLVERGDALAEQKDYNAAFLAYRQAYAFDPTNELSLIKMRRMLEAQGLPTDTLPGNGDPAGPSLKPKNGGPNVKASYTSGVLSNGSTRVQLPVPSRRFPKTDVIARSDSLLSVIEQLSQDIGLNVIFDQQVANQLRSQKIAIELRDVTKPKALEMILRTNNLMYSQLDSRTIVIALDNPQSRMKYEQYAIRTFYVKNADIGEVRTAIQSALQTKSITPVKQLNALIVRDVPQNLELIESMINSLDKSRAEVLIDVNIYEVSRNDLLQLGHQFNTPGGQPNAANLGFLGGLGQAGSLKGVSHFFVKNASLGFALGLPPSAISFFQDKGKAKLLASTQVHVLDDQDQSIRIGQRVPIQTASLPTFSGITDRQRNQGTNQAGVNPNDLTLGLGGAFAGIPQFQYENVGLNIDMKPTVFEDEVQMKMKIESSSLDRSTGNFTPSFNQRTMSSVARIKDGQTTLIAGVSQTEESKQVKGIPLIGLIPILGRFFSTPSTVDRQSDVVITVTPHILRRADIREEDHYAYKAGTGNDTTTQLTIEQIIFLADQDAQANQVATNGKTETPGAAQNKPVVNLAQPLPASPRPETVSPGVVVMPAPTSTPPAASAFKPKIERTTVESPGARPPANKIINDDDDDDDDDDEETPGNPQGAPVTMSIRSASAVATKGNDLYVAVIVNGNAEVSSANVAISYDPAILDVKGVRDGGLLRSGGVSMEPPQFSSEGGMLNVQMDRPQGSGGVAAHGQLLIVIFTVRGPGVSPLALNEQATFLRSPAGQPIPLKLVSSQVEVR